TRRIVRNHPRRGRSPGASLLPRPQAVPAGDHWGLSCGGAGLYAGSCPGPRAGGDHLSERSRERPGAEALVRPTRELGRAVLERSLLGLAPGGACRAEPVTRLAGDLFPPRFTLTARAAVCSLWRFPRVAPPGCYPAPCPAESGRSSSVAARGR